MKIRVRKIPHPHDPYIYLLLQIVHQALSDIDCYYNKKGTQIQQTQGARAVYWIKRGDGIFPLIAEAAGMTGIEFDPHTFHVWLNRKVEAIKDKGKSSVSLFDALLGA